jgi:hypothetical protein
LHLGTGSRVQRVLQKAMSGGAVTMSVLGGSGMSFPSMRGRHATDTATPWQQAEI